MIPKTPTRIVLDTNVCLDLFVFRDPRWQVLHQALREGQLQAITREDCRREWQLVVAYPKLGLGAPAQAEVMAAFDATIVTLPLTDTMPSLSRAVLPVCRDPDDQKFLEIARDSGAALLITKDKALLKLARKTHKAQLFRILSPEAWTAEQHHPTAEGLPRK